MANILGTAGDDILFGTGGDDYIRGFGGSDLLIGNAGNDILDGGAGVDALYGGDGDDVLTSDGDGGQYFGEAGNDTMYSGLGSESMDGGAGIDVIDHRIYNDDYHFNMASGKTQFETESFRNFENALMGSGNDTVIGNAADNEIRGGGGNDTLAGHGGNDRLKGDAGNDLLDGEAGADLLDGGVGTDTASYSSASVGVTVNLSLVAAQNTVGAGTDTLVSIENLTGSSFNDSLSGSASNNVLDGAVGTDTVSYSNATKGVTVILGVPFAQNTVGAGTDTILNVENLTGSNYNDSLSGNTANNILNGGAGADTVSYSNVMIGVAVNLGLTTAQNTVGGGIDTLSNFENLTGSNFNDTLTGNAGSNLLIGGLGNDILNGGTGTDTVSYETATVGVSVNLSLPTAQNTVGAGTDTLSNFENLRGSNFNDTLTGNAGNNLIIGGLGNDVLNGGVGTDTASYNTASAGVTVNLTLVAAQNTVGAGTDTLTNIEDLIGSNFNDLLTGTGGNNVFTGLAGDDLLNGGGGIDTASYSTATAGVTVNLGLAASQNTVAAGFDTLVSIENLIGSNFNDTLLGNGGNNVLEGLAGNDVLNGGGGSDTALYSSATAGVTVNLSLVAAQNTVGAGTDTLTSMENLIGSNFNDILIGTNGANRLEGGNGKDSFNGGAGADTFVYGLVSHSPVGAGRDSITGFEGAGVAGGDVIDLTGIDANATVAGAQAFTWIGNTVPLLAGQAGYAGGVLMANINGGAVDLEIQLVGAPALAVGDVLL